MAEHYSALSVDELIASVLAHYERLWPRIEELVRDHERLVLEGSALWPARVATLAPSDTAAVWLTVDTTEVRDRIRTAGDYAGATAGERALMDKFAARTERFQQLVLADVERLGLTRIDGTGRSVAELADLVLTTALPRS